jgi:hypothetical protein
MTCEQFNAHPEALKLGTALREAGYEIKVDCYKVTVGTQTNHVFVLKDPDNATRQFWIHDHHQLRGFHTLLTLLRATEIVTHGRNVRDVADTILNTTDELISSADDITQYAAELTELTNKLKRLT